MPTTTRDIPDAAIDRTLAGLTPVETARYTKELLDSLRGIALRQEQLVLASLLEAAAREAKRLMAHAY